MNHAIAAMPAASQKALSAVYKVRQLGISSSLPRIVIEMLAFFDGERTLGEVCARAQISEEKGLAVIKKLSGMGVIEERTPGEGRASMSGSDQPSAPPVQCFEAAEEDFFASEVKPIDLCDEPFSSASDKVSAFVSDFVLRIRGVAL